MRRHYIVEHFYLILITDAARKSAQPSFAKERQAVSLNHTVTKQSR